MGLSPFRGFEPNLDISKVLGEKPDFGLNVVEPVQARTPTQDVPKHALISSLRMKARQREQERLQKWNESVDEPAILRQIQETQEQAAERDKRFSEILHRLENPDVPLEETNPVASLGEAIAGFAGLATGDRNAPNSVSDLGKARAKAVFANRMSKFGLKRQADQTALARVSQDIDYLREMAARGQQDLRNVKNRRADMAAEGVDRLGQIDAGLDMTELNDLYDRAREHRAQVYQSQLRDEERVWQTHIAELRKKDAMEATAIETEIAGLKAGIDPKAVPGAIQALRAKGVPISENAVKVFEGMAQANLDDREFARFTQRAQLQNMQFNQGMANREQNFREFSGGVMPGSFGQGPGGGFITLTPNAGGVGMDGLPDAGKAQEELNKLFEAMSAYRVVAEKVGSMEGGKDRNGKPRDPNMNVDYGPAKANKLELESKVGRLRNYVWTNAAPEWKLWVLDKAEEALDGIRQVRDLGGNGVGIVSGALSSGAKAKRDEIARQFKVDTGFDLEDKRITEALKKSNAGPTKPVTVQPGPIGKR